MINMYTLEEYKIFESLKSVCENLSINELEEIFEDDLINEKKIKRTKKMKNSNKVIAQVTKELFGKEGTKRGIVDKLFKMLSKGAKAKAKELGVPIGQVKLDKITLRK